MRTRFVNSLCGVEGGIVEGGIVEGGIVEGGIVEAVVDTRLGRCGLSRLPFDGEGEDNIKTDSAARISEQTVNTKERYSE
jgi:hypothetical protein